MDKPANIPIERAKTLSTRQLCLRELRAEDAAVMAQLLTDWDVVKQTVSVPYPYEERTALSWIARMHNRQGDRLQDVFAITRTENDTLIGTVSLERIGGIGGTLAQIGYWLSKPNWGFGFATEAVHAMTNFGFDELKLEQIEAAVFKDNVVSARVLEKVGYRLERTETHHYPDRGGNRKVMCYVARNDELKDI